MVPDITRPPSLPVRGTVQAFDAGWDAHRNGLGRDTVRVVTPPLARGWALLGWDSRYQLTKEDR